MVEPRRRDSGVGLGSLALRGLRDWLGFRLRSRLESLEREVWSSAVCCGWPGGFGRRLECYAVDGMSASCSEEDMVFFVGG